MTFKKLDSEPPVVARRAVLYGVSAISLSILSGCGGSDAQESGGNGGDGGNGAGGKGGAGGNSGSTTSAGGQGGTGGETTSGTTSATTSTMTGWASGGTASMSGDYADPFTENLGDQCALLCSSILGPCYGETIDRKDISEGYTGLPVRLAFLVVDETCKPIPGATVDVWHTRNTGIYSGDDTPASCTGDDADAKTHKYFRGIQTADDKGRVDFDTCYPGWYGGRCIHFHVTIRIGAQAYVTSQLYFADSLNQTIFAEHPDYKQFGQPDTNNLDDNFYPGKEYEMSTEKQADGALLAWKVLVIRSSLATPLCAS